MCFRTPSSEVCTFPLGILWAVIQSHPRIVTLLLLLVCWDLWGRFGTDTPLLAVACSYRWDLIGGSPISSPRTCTLDFFTFY